MSFALKVPRAGDYRVQGEHGGSMTMASPPGAVRDAADRCLNAYAAMCESPITYARVDLVVADEEPLLMELELV